MYDFRDANTFTASSNDTKLQNHEKLLLQPFNGLFSRTTWVSRYQKGKPIWILLEQEWQWHQLGHMQVCTSLQIDNHASTPPLSFLQAGCLSCHPTNSVKALKALQKHDKAGTKMTNDLWYYYYFTFQISKRDPCALLRQNIKVSKGTTLVLMPLPIYRLDGCMPTTGFPCSCLPKIPGLSRTPEAFFQDQIVSQQYLNIQTNSSY